MTKSLGDEPERVTARPSDEERERYTAVLAESYSTGRLDYDTFQARVDRALVALSRGELDELVVDLPRETGSRPVPARSPSGRPPPRRGWLVAGVAVAAIAVTPGVVQGAFGGSPSPSGGVCIVTGLAAGEDGKCPPPTRVQREIQGSVDRARASADQAAAAADGADEQSRVHDLAEAAHVASDQAARALARAQAAAASAEPDAGEVIAAAARRADQAADDADRAAISADLEASD